jgi:hypothetical protein
VAETDSAKWKDEELRYDSKFRSNTGLSALVHTIPLGEKSTLKSSIAYSINTNGNRLKYLEDSYHFSDVEKSDYRTSKWTVASTLNHKFNNRLSLRTGTIINFIRFKFYQQSGEHLGDPLEVRINTTEGTQTFQAFAQAQYKAADNLTFNLGGHYLNLLYNQRSSLEPRASIKWDLNHKHSIAFGYGLHSQVQGWGIYFAQVPGANNGITQPNKYLDFTKAHHYVLSHNLLLNRNLRLKSELYYQKLYNVPVSNDPAKTFSTLNVTSEYITDPLVNKGKGRNYGAELSVEKYLSDHFYWTLSNSFYKSMYTASDGVERNTRFNGGHINTLLAGKEFISERKSKTFGINIKTIYAGGLRSTPINLAESRARVYAVYIEQEAFTLKNPSYFRTDLRAAIKWNKKNRTNTLSLDLQNVTNRANVFSQWFDAKKGTLAYSYQNGLIPVLNYKVEF